MAKNIKGSFIGRLQLSDGLDRNGIKHVQLLRTGTFKHPSAPNGAFSITPEILLKMKANFDGNARRLDKGELPLDYGHESEGKAAGWISSVELEDDNNSLWVDINYTAEAERAVIDREWRFISADIDFEYTDNESGVMLGPVLLGAGLVNRPHIKSMKAVFGEVGEYDEEENETTINKGYTMTPEEMLKKIGELEAAISNLKAQLSKGTDDVAAAEKKMGDMAKKEESLKEQLKEATAQVTKLSEEKEAVAKEARFTEYLAAGKVIPAQKEAFMTMSLELSEKLFKDAKTANFSDNGHGTNNGKKNDGDKSASDIVDERAKEMMKSNSTIKLGEAYSRILSEDKDLNAKYMAETSKH